MKKITTHAFVFLLLVSTAMAGNQSGKKNNGTARHGQGNSTLTIPFYSEDFASGIPGTWQSTDNVGDGVVWRYTTTGSSLSFGNLNPTGTTAANGYVILDSDSAFPSGADAELITDAIDCSAKTNVHLTFNEFFVQWSTSIGYVWVSNDGTTWNDVFHAESGLGSGQTTANPDMVDIDISTFAAGMATVYVKFEYIGTTEYYWEVDDIALYEIATADGGVTAISAPVTSCSLLSATEAVTVEITNFATVDMSGFDVTFVADGGLLNTETITDTIAPGGTMVYTFTATADLSLPGAHNILAYTNVAGDADNSNDQIAIDVYSGPHVVDQVTHYMQGFEPTEDQSGWTSLDVDADAVTWGLSGILPRTGAVGASYVHELPTNQADDYFFSTCLGLDAANVYQLDFYYRNFSPAYQSNMEVILCTDQDPATVVATLVPTMLVNTSIWTLSSSTIYIPGAASGNYYIGWHVTQQDSATSLKLDDIDIYYSGPNSLPVINSAALTIYPNPTSGMVSIRGIHELTEITVYDMLGNVVLVQSATSGVQVLDLSSQTQGVYSVVMRAEKSVTTKQLIITGK
ncbi:hypothetical protein BH11BAC1_BH11BAC1_00320 [soil metagenome]